MTIDRFPLTASVTAGRLAIDGIDAEALAGEHGTPLYVYDATTVRARARAYVEPLRATGGRAVFALKANATPAILRLLREEGMGADAASAGEIAAARVAGFDGGSLVVHGNAKGEDDLASALDAGAGLVVLDAPEEAEALARLAVARGVRQAVLVRVTPDIGVDTHEKIRTGHAGSKFGLAPDAAWQLIASLPEGLVARGLHVHLGSQVVDAGPLREAVAWCASFCARVGYEPPVLDLGGGLGVAYLEEEVGPDPRTYAAALASAVPGAFAAVGLSAPELVLEPGRSVVGPAGVTLYRVRTVKRAASGTVWVAVDGGMADNPRVALYGARYRPVLATRLDASPTGSFAIAGRHCESGDALAFDVPLPDPRPGDLLALPVTGAYHQSMASTYNLFGRPAAVLVEGGVARLVTRRETVDDLLARDI